MIKAEKERTIEELRNKLETSKVFYLADVSGLTVEASNKLRRACFNKKLSIRVVKNTLLKKALSRTGKDYRELPDVLKGNTSIIFSETGNLPARVIKNFRKDYDRPLLKAAFVEENLYFGDARLDELTKLKSKRELLSDLVGMLYFPSQNLLAALHSGKHQLTGLLKALKQKAGTVSGQKSVDDPRPMSSVN